MHWSLATIVLVPRGTSRNADADQRREAFDWAAAAGFEGVELSSQWLDFLLLSDAEVEEIGREAAARSLKVSGLNISRCIPTRSERAAANRELLFRAVHVAALLAAPVITLSLSMPLAGREQQPPLRGSEVPPAEQEEAVDLIRKLAEAASLRGVSPSLELHDDGLLDTAELCLEMLDRVAATNVGLNPDLGNLIRSDAAADWQNALRQLAPHANNWHVKNYRRGEPAPIWDGDIEYAHALAIMREAGYGGWVSIESYFGDVRRLQEQSLAWLQRASQGAPA